MFRYLADKFASKKLAAVVLATGVLILSGAGVVVFPDYVVAAAGSSFVSFITMQGVVDAVTAWKSGPPTSPP